MRTALSAIAAITLAAWTPNASAQDRGAPRALSFAQLQNVVSRVALYPDPLLAQVLAASTYAEQIPEAARWADAHSYLNGDELGRAALGDHLPWNPSVQALVPFPSVLDLMAADPRWTSDLGNAILMQRSELMDGIQTLRRQAMDFGYLRNGQQVRVEQNGRFIAIQPESPGFMYVPIYNPSIVFASRRSGSVFGGGGISYSTRVPIAGGFSAWGWALGGPRFDWAAHAMIIDRDPWNRTWSNRQTYQHPYANASGRSDAAAHQEELHRVLQRDDNYYRKQREQQDKSGMGHINQEAPKH